MAEQNVVIKIQADVSKATNDVKALQQVIAKLSTSGTQAAAGTERVGNAAKKTATASQLLDREIKKVVAGQGNLDRVADLATATLKEQEIAAERLARVSGVVEKAVGKQGAAALGANKQIGGLADASGSASFAILSLGQAFQDSAQFGMGLAQGLRAVNNNIQQTFTAIALGSVQMGGFNNLVKAMGKSLLGPGGLILGFSAFSAALEFFTTRAQRAASQVKELNNATKDLLEIVGSPEGIEINLDKLTDLTSAQEKYVDMLEQQVEGDMQSYELNKVAFPLVAKFYADRVSKTRDQIEAEKERLVTLEEMRNKEEALFATAQRLAREVAPSGPDLGPIPGLSDEDLGERLETIKDLIRDAASVSVEAIRQMSIDLEGKNLADIVLPEADALDLGERLTTVRDTIARTAEDMRTLSLETEDAILNFQLPEGELGLGKALETEADAAEKALDRMNKAFQNTVRNGITDMIVGLGELASGEGNVAQKLLLPIADMAIQLGKIAIGTGIALEGIKNAFRNLNPAVAIAAGVALVALGSAVKSRIKAAGKGASSASSAGARPNFTMPNPLTSPASFSSQGMFPATTNTASFSGRFVASGRDLVAVVSAETDARQELGFTRNLVIGG